MNKTEALKWCKDSLVRWPVVGMINDMPMPKGWKWIYERFPYDKEPSIRLVNTGVGAILTINEAEWLLSIKPIVPPESKVCEDFKKHLSFYKSGDVMFIDVNTDKELTDKCDMYSRSTAIPTPGKQYYSCRKVDDVTVKVFERHQLLLIEFAIQYNGLFEQHLKLIGEDLTLDNILDNL